mmetsp:Transcript_28514/g.63641  ORF Transcript_28514/g.63641 Transcript_28514/m.63641 type:complete len:132 (-) Transcript_28514:100-495(-)
MESEEERGHALKILDFAKKRDVALKLDTLRAPKTDWGTAIDVWNDLLGNEQKNTESLFKLADSAQDARDHALASFLIPFHHEQVESEDNLKVVISKVEQESLTPGLLQQLDQTLGERAQLGARRNEHEVNN